MAEGSNQSQYTTAEKSEISDDNRKETKTIKKKQKGILSRIWNRIFRDRNEDFEKRLQYLSKEEASVLARMKRRSQRGRKIARNIIVLSVILEVIAVAYAIIITRSFDLDWKMRAVRVLPMFLLPGLSSIIYSTLVSFTRMRERKDQKTLERLRAERQAKIDELKERTNYYITQQLIQRYDPDPAAKAAAATVLASKLGLDSGLQVYLKEDTKVDQTSGKSKDFELAQSDGLRNRRPSHTSSKNARNHLQLQQSVQEGPNNTGSYGTKSQIHNQVIVVNHHQNSIAHDSGWIARIAALLVGEDPKQSYALICGNCHMHNGLARKEEFPFITYYCQHCHALNKSKQSEGNFSVSNSGNVSSPETPSSGNILKNGPDIGSRNVLTTSDEISGNKGPDIGSRNVLTSIVDKIVEEERPS